MERHRATDRHHALAPLGIRRYGRGRRNAPATGADTELIAAKPRTRAKLERLPTSRAGDPGREVRRRTSGRRGSGPSPSCYPNLRPTDLRGTSDIAGRVRVGRRRRLPPPNQQALNRSSLRSLMLQGAKYFSRSPLYPPNFRTKPYESRSGVTVSQQLRDVFGYLWVQQSRKPCWHWANRIL